MTKKENATAAATAPVVSIRDGGMRAASLARDLTEFGATMITIWPELANDYASGDAKWANFDGGAAEDYDAKHGGVYVAVTEDDTWALSDAAKYDVKIDAALLKTFSRTKWAAMKKDEPTLYAIAQPVNRKVNLHIADARRVLKDAVRKALAATNGKTKSGNRTHAEWLNDELKAIATKFKTADKEQATLVRAWLAAAPKI